MTKANTPKQTQINLPDYDDADLEYELLMMNLYKIDWSDRKQYETIAKKMKNLPQGEKMELCDEIRKRCEALIDLGDDKAYKSAGVPDDELIDGYCWVMDSERDDLGERRNRE